MDAAQLKPPARHLNQNSPRAGFASHKNFTGI
jgi:hypothetical protein